MSEALHVLLPTLGSAGDVHPVIALALALKARGHRATIITNPLFQEQIEKLDIGFMPVGTSEKAQELIANPDLWDPKRGFEVIAEHVMIPSLQPVYDAIATHAGPNTVVASSAIAFGARVAQEKLGVPTATVILQPAMLRSLHDSGMFGMLRISASQPRWFKKALYRLVDWVFLDKRLRAPINKFRSRLGLEPVKHVMDKWMLSPELIIALFPEWFAPPQPDWPSQLRCVGFVLWDASGHSEIPEEAQAFLDAGEPPVIFTPGSAAATLHRFFEESMKAARELNVRAMIVTNFPEQLPPVLPTNVKRFGYLPFSEVLPRAAVLVHHGGIGTTAQTIKAGIPHLVVPNGHDQFDNGWRIEQLRLGHSISAQRYAHQRVTAAINDLLSDKSLHARCADYSHSIDSPNSLSRACDLIESLGAKRQAAPTVRE